MKTDPIQFNQDQIDAAASVARGAQLDRIVKKISTELRYGPGPADVIPDRHAVLPATLAGIGDVNSTEKGSGARYNDGKPDLSLIPLCTLEDEARVWMYGKAKYAAFNWMKGMDWSVPLACALRHLAAWQRGEQNDPESGLPHLAHVMCNIRMLTLYEKMYPEGDDRPPQEFIP